VGVHTSYGVPVVQADRTILVLVFYSCRYQEVNRSMRDYIRDQVATWRFSTTITAAPPSPAPAPLALPPAPLALPPPFPESRVDAQAANTNGFASAMGLPPPMV
jgi:hypothetical protein